MIGCSPRSTRRVSIFFSLVRDTADATANVKLSYNCVSLARTNLHNLGIRITLSFQSAPQARMNYTLKLPAIAVRSVPVPHNNTASAPKLMADHVR
jgi:hypothetical protein